MKKNPKDGGYYQRSVRDVKRAVNAIARKTEKQFGLPSGTVAVSITKLQPATRQRLVEKFAS